MWAASSLSVSQHCWGRSQPDPFPNIVLHYVLDDWFERDVQPRLKGRSFLIRYADDFVMGFGHGVISSWACAAAAWAGSGLINALASL